ncbi:hypothetical protein K5X82_06525 [Halosquirtibacter xylanolyticus]|uniref:toxin-antitoxin system YwqK family antitoxin n=1 Tax=Halosquirtibacter xylanolyticus TaxID=3374599 RepID=UPI003748014A|nr:hypothetical protein K5X82_06525 [Prolixibacteraceae bacterium]
MRAPLLIALSITQCISIKTVQDNESQGESEMIIKDSLDEPMMILDLFPDFEESRVNPSLYLDDYSMISFEDSIKVSFNECGQMIDSETEVPLNRYLMITLHDDDDTSVVEKVYSMIGELEGNIIDGRREGVWTKTVYFNIHSYVVKRMSYKNGLLDGDYIVYNLRADILNWSYETVLDESNLPVSKKVVSRFHKGTGPYKDYYYDTGRLKISGSLFRGKRDGIWSYYAKDGELLFRERYSNGILITNLDPFD